MLLECDQLHLNNKNTKFSLRYHRFILVGPGVCERSQITQLCGSPTPYFTFVSQSNSMTLRLETDDTTVAMGFISRYTNSKCSDCKFMGILVQHASGRVG